MAVIGGKIERENKEKSEMALKKFETKFDFNSNSAKKVYSLYEVKKITGVDNCGLIKEIVCKLGGDRFIKDGRVYYRLPNTIE